MNDKGKGGLLLLCGATILLFGMMLAEFTFEGYSVSQNYISDLGAYAVMPAAFFNLSIITSGLMNIYAGYLFRRSMGVKWFGEAIMLVGVGTVLVGIFNESTIMAIHLVGAFMAFIFGGLATFLSAKHVYRPPTSYLFYILTGITFFFLAVTLVGFSAHVGGFLGLGQGGSERMIVYPTLISSIATGAYLAASSQTTTKT
jgi:hypothetical membrane protein